MLIKIRKLKLRLLQTLTSLFVISGLIAGTALFLSQTVKADSSFTLNEASGTTIHDTSGSASGTITNAVWEPASMCASGPCLYFNGSALVNFGNEATYNFTASANFSLEFWFRTSPISSGSRVMLAKYNSATGTDGGYKIYMSSDGKVNFGIDDSQTGFPKDIATSASRYDDNLWHHIEAVKSGTTSITLYVDAVQADTKSGLSTTGSLASTDPFYIGIDGDGSSNGFTGFIDEIKIHVSAARTAAQVKSDYQKGSGPNGTNVRFGPDTSNLTNGLVGYWKMDETTSPSVDSSGNNNSGTWYNHTTYGTGKFGNAAVFDGTDDYISVPNNSVYKPVNQITISAWFNSSSFSGTRDLTATEVTNNGQMRLFINSSKPKFALTFTNYGSTYTSCTSCSTLSTGTWYHLVGVYNGKMMLVYLNGQIIDSQTIGSDTINQGSNALTIGRLSGEYFQGSIDEVRIYNRALSPAEVQQLYNWAPGPAAYYKFDDAAWNGTSGDVTDSSGNNYNGTDSGDASGTVTTVSGASYLTDSNQNWGTNGLIGGTVTITGGTGSGQSRSITANSGTALTISPNWSPNLNTTSTYTISGTPNLVAPTLVNGKFGNAANFSTTNGTREAYVTIPGSNSGLNITGSITLETWVKFNNLSSWQNQHLISKMVDASDNINYRLWIREQDSLCTGGNFCPEFSYTDTGSGGHTWMATNSLTAGVWTHLAVTFTYGTGSSLKMYVNGQSVAGSWTGGNGNVAPLTSTSWPLFFGTDRFNGLLDDVKIYNYARTQAQIVSDMNGGHPAVGGSVGSALVHYPFDEGYGTSSANTGSLGSTVNATASGTLWNPNGKLGYALQFNGTSSFASSPKLALLAGDTLTYSTLTWGGWFNPTASATSQSLLIKNNEFQLTTDSNSKANCAIYSGSWQTAAVSATALPVNAWSHVLCTYDGTNIYVYVNGVQSSSQTQTGAITSSASTGLNLGWNSAGGSYFSGLIDEQVLYNFALTSDQVKVEYNHGMAQVLGSLSDTSNLTGGNVASQSASAAYCVPGSSDSCSPPVAEWKFDEGTGGTAHDTSGNNLTATYGDADLNPFNPSWTTGKQGFATDLTKTSDYYWNVPYNSLFDVTNFTLEAWIYPKTVSGTQNFLCRNPSFSSNACQYGLYLFNGEVRLGIYTSGASEEDVDTTNTNLSANKWYFVSATYQNSTKNVVIYVNGIPQATSGSITQNMDTSTNGFEIGYDYVGRYYNGYLDTTRLYNYVRTPAQIAWDYNRGAPVAQYEFDECTGATLHNSALASSGQATSGIDGTITPNTGRSTGTCSSGNSNEMWNGGTTGKYGASLAFDGAGDFVATANTTLVAANAATYTNISWGGWFKPSSSPVSKTLIQKDTEFRLTTDSSGNPQCERYSSSWQPAVTSPTTLSQSTWSHLLCTYDGANLKLYVNGQLIKSLPQTNAMTSSASTALDIARDSGGTGYFPGQIDAVRIYNYALTATQVKTLYNQNSAVRF